MNQSTHSSVANSNASKLLHGPRRWVDFSLVETVDRFGEGVVVTVADASDGRHDSSFCQPLGIPDGYILDAAIRVVHEAATMSGTPIMKSLLQGMEDKASICRPARTPSNDATSKGVDDIRANAQHLSRVHVDKTLPCGDVGEVCNPACLVLGL